MSDLSRASVTIHTGPSLDGKISGSAMRHSSAMDYGREFSRIDNEYFKPFTQVCIVGRNTLRDTSVLEVPENYPASDRPGDRTDFHADLATNPVDKSHHYYAWLDPHGRLGWKANTRCNNRFPFYNGDRLVEVLVEDFVTDDFLAQLRKVNVPYIFAGKSELDCRIAVDKLCALFNTDTVVCHGGGTINGTLLEQNVVKHLSYVLVPVVSGDPEAVSVFNPMPGGELHMKNFDLEHVEPLSHGEVWLRYVRRDD